MKHMPSYLIFAMMAVPMCASADVRLPHVLSDHMVLQRNAPIHVWGWANPGERVRVALDDRQAEGVTDAMGHWSLFLAPHGAGGPYDLTVQGNNEWKLSDVLVGDVWIASGQSNMEMPLKGFSPKAQVKDSEMEIAHADHARIRLLHLGHVSAVYPLDEAVGTWSRCTPETAASFSAVAYFFGREIDAHEHVPIGLVDATWGGTPAESWVSMDGLASEPALSPVFSFWARFSAQQKDLQATIALEKLQDEEAAQNGELAPEHPWHPAPESWAPAGLFNGMIAPLTPMTICGVIWYQGETNSGIDRVSAYRTLFAKLIEDWRGKWNQGDFPFLFTQISSYRSNNTEDWGKLRDAQRRSLSVAHTAMAVTLDIGEPDNVHPADKQTVGLRLSLAARALAYGESVDYQGPLYRMSYAEGSAIRVWFLPSGDSLHCVAACEGFEVAGDDCRFHPAQATIEGRSVLVKSAEVIAPKYVRYAWDNAPRASLTGAGSLPASTFTSDNCRDN